MASLAIAMGVTAPAAWAFGFGEPEVASGLGQPLRLRIPLRVDPDGDLTSQCVRLIGSAGTDGIPTLTMAMARISVERKGDGRILRVDSVYPINEPVLRVSIEAGCAQHARREFVLLLDPPDTLPKLAITAPDAAAPAPQPVAAAASAATAPAAVIANPPAPDANAAPAGSVTSDSAAALVLGAATITGRMGEPLSLQVPVTGTDAATLDAGCVRLAGAWTGEGPPVLSLAHLAVVRTAAGTQIDLLTDNAVTVPALRVVLEAGCAVVARREYAVNLDGAAAAAATPEPAPAPTPQADTAAAAAAAAAAPGATTGAAPAVTAATADTKPAAPPRPRKTVHKPIVADRPGTAPAQPPVPAPAAGAKAAAGPAPRTGAAPRSKTPAADHLVLAAPSDQPDPAAERIAEMDKRIAALTQEVTMLRSEMAADRQRAAAGAESPQHLSAGWIVAILALLGLGISGLMNLQRKRSGMPWEKPTWEPTVTAMPTVMPAAANREPAAAPPPPAVAPVRAAAPAPAAATAAPSSKKPAAPVPPLPRTGPLAAFDEFTGVTSTLPPEPDGPQTRIEVTELHADDPALGKMHTVFLEPGNLDAPPPERAVAGETRIPGPPPEPTQQPARPVAPAVASPFVASLPVADLPPMPPPTVVAPEHRHGEFTFDEGPFTQTPTMLVLDLDLTTRAVPPEEAEIAKFAEAAQKLNEPAAGDAAGTPPAGEPRKGYSNGH